MADRQSGDVYSLYLKKSLYNAAFFILVPFLALFLPFFKGKKRIAAASTALAVISGIFIFSVFPIGSYKITSEPVVINTGTDYSVVFSTSHKGTGFIEYSYEGKDYKVYDNNAGRLNTDSKIHSINIPYEHLQNNSYKIGSVRVIA